MDDPDWIAVSPGEIVTGVEGIDWVWNYGEKLGPRQYGKMKRNLPMNSSWPGTRESAMQLLVGPEFLRSGQSLLQDRWGGRVIWGVEPDESYDPEIVPYLGEM